jgi:hypothetical protein
MPGITIKPGSSKPWMANFKQYAKWYTEAHPDANAAELFVDQCRKTAVELYQQTVAVSPTKAEIVADVKSRGWHIPAFFGKVERDDKGHIEHGERIGRGLAKWWAAAAEKRRDKRRKGRPTTAAQKARDERLSRRPTLAQMQAYAIAVRNKARLFVASGWLGASSDLGGSLSLSSGNIDHERGGAVISRQPGKTIVTLWNKTPGVEKLNARSHFVRVALIVRAADMAVYVRRKAAEAAQRFLRKK